MNNSPHSLHCCVCGDLIIFEKAQTFMMEAFINTLHAHEVCLNKVTSISDWTELPKGPLKQAFEKLPDPE